MSIAEVLVLALVFAFMSVGLVGFLGWRSRMRSPVKTRDRRRVA